MMLSTENTKNTENTENKRSPVFFVRAFRIFRGYLLTLFRLDRPLPVSHVLARGAGQTQTTIRYVAADRRTRAHRCPFANPYRRHQRAVGADKRVVADQGLVLVGPIVVAGDGARADINPRADLGIAQLGQVVDLGTRTDAGLFGFDEITDMHARRQL